MYRLALLAVSAAAAAAPAEAHWRYTRWGMSPAEVQAANPAVRLGVDAYRSIEGSLVRMAVDHRERGRMFTARFGFDAQGRLNTVYLDALNPHDCPRILAALERTHGPGEIRGDASFAFESLIWPRARRGNYIQTIRIGDAAKPTVCSVRYHPRGGPPPETPAPESSEI